MAAIAMGEWMDEDESMVKANCDLVWLESCVFNPVRVSNKNRELFANLMVRYTDILASGRKTVWKQIVSLDPTGVSTIGPTSMTPDGKTHMYGFHRALGDLYLVEGLK